MTKKTRRLIFLTCFFLFVLITPVLILYSQGYRFDFQNKKLTQTGGLFLRVVPKRVDVYLNKKLWQKTDFFFGSVLIKNLLPKEYNIEIKKEGYHSWEKTLKIEKEKVTEAKNIILFPEDINFQILAEPVNGVWFSPSQKYLLIKQIDETGWSLKLLDKKTKSLLVKEGDLSSQGADLVNLEFSENEQKIYLTIKVKDKIKHFSLEKIDTPPPIISEIIPAQKTQPENAIAYQSVNNDEYYLDKLGYLFKNKQKLNLTPFPIETETSSVELQVFSDSIFLKQSGHLFKFNNELKKFESVASDINFLKVSPDNKKLLLASNNELWLLFLDELTEPIKKTKGEKLFLARLINKITDVYWLNDYYLTFMAGDQIKIIEIDERDKFNLIDLFEIKKLPFTGSETKIFWNPDNKKIYLWTKETLFISDAPLF
ncbi:MAG: hypothetical protein ACPLW9_00245 [Minisyncoccales bacterium]